MIFYKNLKFHDISMTGKAPIIFQGFPGFPGAVGTLLNIFFFLPFVMSWKVETAL